MEGQGRAHIPHHAGFGLLSMPPEILDNIASFAAGVYDFPCDSAGPSSMTVPTSFLYDASVRMSHVVTPPTDLYSLQLVCKQFHSLLALRSNPGLYARVFRSKFDVAAIGRRFGKQALTSSSLANELRRRCRILKRMRKAVEQGRMVSAHSDSSSAAAQEESELTENLWLAYLMMLENDGLNYQQLCWAQVHSYLALHHTAHMLEAAVEPGYPSPNTHKALALHLIYLLTDPEQLALEPRGESDERLFVLRSFVFAAHRFDAFLAPWVLRNLPVSQYPHRHPHSKQPIRGATPVAVNPFLANAVPKPQSCQVEHCGGTISIVPPNLAQGALFSFFMKVEKDPAVLGMTALMDPEDLNSETSVHLPRTTRPPMLMTSADHDKDITRLLSCLDARTSPGLPALFCKGMFEGTWEGRFSFFDFDSYREMLAGRMRSLYEGPFGEQPQIWKIKEKIVKLGPGELEGGPGSVLAAGYSASAPADPTTTHDPATDVATTHDKDKGKAVLPNDWHQYPTFPDEDGRERYEILLSGTGHSAWGRFVLRGRVRSWDGMLLMTKEYRPDGRGKWLYRGYSVAGGKLVGRWRDTFTPDNMYGYEGCFLLHKRDL